MAKRDHRSRSVLRRFIDQLGEPQPGSDPELDAFRKSIWTTLEADPEAASWIRAAREEMGLECHGGHQPPSPAAS